MRRFLLARLVPGALLLASSLPAFAADGTAVDRAMAAFKAGDYAAAVVEVEDVAAADPLYPKARYVLAESWLALGDAENAEKAFREVLEKKPDWVPALVGVGRSLTVLGKHDPALEVLRKAAKADPRDASARRAIGECLAAKGKPEEAQKELEAASRIDPKDPLTVRALVEVQIKVGDHSGAGKAAEAYRQANPKSPLGDFLRALAYEGIGNLKEATTGYEAALDKDPKFLDAHKNLAILLFNDNPEGKDEAKGKKCLEHFEKYFALGGKDKELKRIYDELKGRSAGKGTPTPK
jgi:tetratricopeptide (TPR) repeat protein